MHSYDELVQEVLETGDIVEGRLGRTKELTATTLFCPTSILPHRSKMRRELGYMELCQLLAGSYDLDAIKRVAPKVDTSLFSSAAAYGPRVWHYDQLPNVIEELKNPGSRRAVIMMTEPMEPLAQRPCTSSIQFLKREGSLLVIAQMRSWDLWFGAPYDLMMFAGLCQVVASLTRTTPLGVQVQAGSAHVYEKNWDGSIGSPPLQFIMPFFPSIYDYQAWAHRRVNDETWVKGAPTGVEESIFDFGYYEEPITADLSHMHIPSDQASPF